MKKYSILQTVYKNDNPIHFKLSLESLLLQTVTPDEIILVKDGPVNEAIQYVIDELIEKYSYLGNIIVQVQLEKNIGLGLALNEGLKICKNELIARMDSDDISVATRCEKQLAAFKMSPELDIYGSQIAEFDSDISNIIGNRSVPTENDEIYRFERRRDPFNHVSVMYKRSKVLSVGGYSNYRRNQDTDLWVKMLSNGCKCANSQESLVWVRFDKNAFIKRKSWLNTKTLIEIRYRAMKNGISNIFDFLIVSITQISIFILPLWFQKYIYRTFLRKR